MPRFLKLQVVHHLYTLIVWRQVKLHIFDGESPFDSATWTEFLGYAQRRWGMFN